MQRYYVENIDNYLCQLLLNFSKKLTNINIDKSLIDFS